MLTKIEKIAVCATLGVSEIINGNYEKILSEHPEPVQATIKRTVNAIEGIMKEDEQRIRELEIEVSDLKYQLKELIYRIEERRDIRNDLIYKDLKRAVGVY